MRQKNSLTKVYTQFIGLYGCYLKHKYDEILLIIVGRDHTYRYFHVIFGIVENEIADS